MTSTYKLRHIQERIRSAAKYFKVILITGARQTGKSTLLKNLFPEVPLMTFDRLNDVYDARKNPDLFLKAYKSPLILDEIQYVPELLGSIKRAVDESDKKGQYFLTGSHSLGMLKVAAESMAGRVAIIDLEHFSPFEEFETFSFHDAQQIPPSWLEFYLANPSELVRNFSGVAGTHSPVHSVWRGGFPAITGLPDDAIHRYFDSYLRTYIERDAIYANPSAASPEFHHYLKIMAILTSQEINYAHFGRELGLKTKKDILPWEYVLRQTYQWREVPSFMDNNLERVSERGKGYLTDTGLACYLQGISTPLSLLGYNLLGGLFETHCVNLIYKLISGLPYKPEVYHWSVPSGPAVDIILHMNAKLYPIEIKVSDNPNGYDARGILAFRKKYGDKVQHGIVLHAGTACYPIHEHVTALPFNALIKKFSIDEPL